VAPDKVEPIAKGHSHEGQEKDMKELITNEIIGAINEALEEHGSDVDELIPLLVNVNNRLGYLPVRAIAEISLRLRLPISRIYSVASFYNMISIEQRGEHIIQFCESAPCHVMGGRQILQTLRDNLKIAPGQTTPDGKWTLVLTSCLGTCGVGPVMIVDDEIYGNLTTDQVPDILNRHGSKGG
jgi:NADH-quinone oxidoreductase subunit E